MVDKKITDMSAADTPLAGDEIMEVVQDGINKQVPLSELNQNINTVKFNITPTPGVHETGKIYWDADAGTISIMADVADVVYQMAQEFVLKVKNNAATVIPNGAAVYMVGATGNRPTVELAQADALATADAIGFATAEIAGNGDGYITLLGLVRDLKTNYAGWNVGDYLYLSQTTAGALENAAPVSGYVVRMGRILIIHPNNGIILANQPIITLIP